MCELVCVWFFFPPCSMCVSGSYSPALSYNVCCQQLAGSLRWWCAEPGALASSRPGRAGLRTCRCGVRTRGRNACDRTAPAQSLHPCPHRRRILVLPCYRCRCRFPGGNLWAKPARQTPVAMVSMAELRSERTRSRMQRPTGTRTRVTLRSPHHAPYPRPRWPRGRSDPEHRCWTTSCCSCRSTRKLRSIRCYPCCRLSLAGPGIPGSILSSPIHHGRVPPADPSPRACTAAVRRCVGWCAPGSRSSLRLRSRADRWPRTLAPCRGSASRCTCASGAGCVWSSRPWVLLPDPPRGMARALGWLCGRVRKLGDPGVLPGERPVMICARRGSGKSARRLRGSRAWRGRRLPCVRWQRRLAPRLVPGSWCTCWSWRAEPWSCSLWTEKKKGEVRSMIRV